jgi:16S rRNA G966 N2-methylase RsmD
MQIAVLFLLSQFENLERYPTGFFHGKNVLELGSGTGLIGIVLLLNMGASRVTFTDKNVLLPLIKSNIETNCKLYEITDLEQRYNVQELLWGETPITEKYDYVIVCDCIYESKEMWLPLAKCLQMISDVNPKVRIILAYELRSNKDAAFFPYITQFFSVQPLPEEDYHPEWYTPEIKIFTLAKAEGNSMDLSEILKPMNNTAIED